MRTAAGLSQSQLAASMSARYSVSRYETLKRRLRRLGRTQAWLAEQTGLTPLQVSRYATGATYLTQLSLERATRIAQTVQAGLVDLAQW